MKTLHTRILCLFMAFQVLFASSGFAVYEHFCKIKGATTFHLSAPKKICCSLKKGNKSDEKQSFLKRKKCCSDQISYHKISPTASHEYKFDFKNPLLAYSPVPICAFSYRQGIETIFKNNLLYSNSSPALSGRDKIIFLQSFLI